MIGDGSLIDQLILWWKGYVRIRLCGGNCRRFFNLCANHGIKLSKVQPVLHGYECNVSLKDVYRMKNLVHKCHTRFRIIEKYGLPFFLNRYRKRKVFGLGICCCGFFIYWLSIHIWNIEINGNYMVSRPVFLEYMQEYGVYYGTAKNKIDCKQMAEDIRNHFSDFTWVSVKLQGTGILIDVQENTDTEIYDHREYEDSDLVSNVEGEIVRMITRNGTPVVKVGDWISEEQLLVSGRKDITDDSGNVVKCQYCAADADIYVRTTEKYQDTFSLKYEKNNYTDRKRYGVIFNLGGNIFGCCPFVSQFDTYDVLRKDTRLRLWQDFYLPVTVSVVTAKEYTGEPAKYTENEAIYIAEQKLQKFLSEKEEKGVQIFEKNVKIDLSATLCLAKGTITFVQKAGKRERTEYLELQQENNDS